MTVATEERTIVLPWGITADHPRNADLALQGIPGARLRSRITGMRTVKDARTRHVTTPLDQAQGLSQFPEVPGMQLDVNPKRYEWSIIDPLFEDEELCERIKWTMQGFGSRTADKLKGVAPQKGKLDKSRMKTLVREMFHLVQAREAVVVRGVMPTAEDIVLLPGEFLLNPGSRVQNTQPMYECDWEPWLAQLTRSGG